MKKLFLTLITCSFLPLSAQAEQFWENDPRPPHFCMQNFNAYGPLYASGVGTRTEHMNGFLKAIPKCDVVHLQEVWNAGQIDLVEKSLSSQYSISSPNKLTRIGVMSLFMGDILSSATQEFQVNSDGSILDRARSLASVKKAFHIVRSQFYAIPEDFYFVNTHFHPSSEAVRLTQVLDLLQWRLRSLDAKLLLSGDFNAGLESLERDVLMLVLGTKDAMEDALGGYPSGYCTYCAKNPLGWLFSDQVFDYILYSNVGKSTTTLRPSEGEINMRGTPKKPWSDHYGVRVQFFVEPEGKALAKAELEARRDRTLLALKRTESVLASQKEKEFIPYVNMVKGLQADLENRQGDFNSYFESFR